VNSLGCQPQDPRPRRVESVARTADVTTGFHPLRGFMVWVAAFLGFRSYLAPPQAIDWHPLRGLDVADNVGGGECVHGYISTEGELIFGYAVREQLEILCEPLEEELEFLVVLSEHLRGEKLLSDEMLGWLSGMSGWPNGMTELNGMSEFDHSLYARKKPVCDFHSGTILRRWLATD